jgi:hypothetical protein
VATSRVSVEASRVDSLYVTGIVEISGESKEGSPDCHLDLLLPCADGGKIWQLAHFEIQFLDDAMHLVKDIEEPSIWQIKVFAETVDHNDHPVSVTTVALLDRW